MNTQKSVVFSITIVTNQKMQQKLFVIIAKLQNIQKNVQNLYEENHNTSLKHIKEHLKNEKAYQMPG